MYNADGVTEPARDGQLKTDRRPRRTSQPK